MKGYQLLDSGEGEKLEQYGSCRLIRPCASAVWSKNGSESLWESADARFSREPAGRWESRRRLPERWELVVNGLRLGLSATDFGHIGVFPEHQAQWQWCSEQIQRRVERSGSVRVLNLFAYSGAATLAAARAGAECCHVDASKGMVSWARENAELNGLDGAPIRWIVDDVPKFLQREHRRGRRYDGIILDPPSYGRGPKGEVLKIDRDLVSILGLCNDLLSDDPLFVLLSCHTPGFTALTLENLLKQSLPEHRGSIRSGEMVLDGGKETLSVPSGCFARWSCGRG